MFYVRSGNVKLAVYDLNAGGCETILLIHGWPLSHRMYEYQEDFLVKNGYRVVSMDLRGFGQSDAPACSYSYDQMADDIYAVVCALQLNRFILAGFSMGGAIVMRYMGRYCGYGVKKLCLFSAAGPSFVKRPDFPYGVSPTVPEGWARQASTDRAALAAGLGDQFFAQPHSGSAKQWLGSIALEASGLATIRTACALKDEDCRPDLAKICVPTGIFHGKKDQVVPFDLAMVQNRGIAGSVLYPFAGSGHGIFYDELPLFNDCLLRFLQGRC